MAASKIALRIITLTSQFRSVHGFDLVQKSFHRFVGNEQIG
ncbi:MAG TPA: hypothetical protein VHC72_17625 [Bryobacteraceae bacterium]|nr:hypothetical protein [Bryobacteraceae bacterium]